MDLTRKPIAAVSAASTAAALRLGS